MSNLTDRGRMGSVNRWRIRTLTAGLVLVLALAFAFHPVVIGVAVVGS